MLIGEDFDCVILDIMLPFIDGMTLLKTFRASNALTPVIMLTAKDAVEDCVRGLSGGADDYLVKPFAFSELLARIHAVTRRRGAPAPQARLSAEDLEMDSVKHTVTRGGHIRIGTEQEKGETVITFFNDGPAIGPEHMGRLFDRFYKIDSARPSPDGYGGSGLGLSIVASIMKLHGGRAEVHNAKGGKGVVFRLVFPSKS